MPKQKLQPVWVLWTRLIGPKRVPRSLWYAVAVSLTKKGLPWQDWSDDVADGGRQLLAVRGTVPMPPD